MCSVPEKNREGFLFKHRSESFKGSRIKQHYTEKRWKGKRSGKECEARPLSFRSRHAFYKKLKSNPSLPRSSIKQAFRVINKAYRTANFNV